MKMKYTLETSLKTSGKQHIDRQLTKENIDEILSMYGATSTFALQKSNNSTSKRSSSETGKFSGTDIGHSGSP